MSDQPASDISAIKSLGIPLGRLVTTPNALNQIPNDEMLLGLSRHAKGDWGIMDDHDTKANDEALIHGLRLLSAYESQKGVRFWIITEHDRSLTTILLPEDY